MSGLIGGASAVPLQEADYRSTPAWSREEKGWPSSSMVGGASMIIGGSWWEEPDTGWGGPNYAPYATPVTGPTVQSAISSAAALAIYDSP